MCNALFSSKSPRGKGSEGFVVSSHKVTCICQIKGTLSGLRKVLATESSLKLMRNTFYSTLKAHGHIGKPLDLKDKVNFKFTTSQPGAQTMTIHILPNISRSKGNETMKFSQLIEYYKRKIIRKVRWRNFPEQFLKNQN